MMKRLLAEILAIGRLVLEALALPNAKINFP